ncbi:monosaccharide ABC transporter ATP-binding protein, CUT2 family [Faunimonas pinastri]|uniref:Monosaccharide ABC transporter ATP-binding protein, CUT2 family n=1 Tax=Faunimonas pinastri TaxID=1855383 RepID=A0A1H9NVF7_9HYPH|nr:sugar ABC transporter ATP-binding protein [Faunimonas pinastri]SER40014.1 monosaccharide ABC transporter ATP-binding protein, CUT2 family [Faunimonas pinastri]
MSPQPEGLSPPAASPGHVTGAAPVLEIHDVSKSFGPVQALKRMELAVTPGRVHTLLGENGAGKSTLMKILAGVFPPSGGTIRLNGKDYLPRDPKDAAAHGVSIIFQELSLSRNLTVAENIYANREVNRFGFIQDRKLNEDAAQLIRDLGLPLDPRARVADLSIAKRQLVEIAKGLSHPTRLVIMDEPTSSLSDSEAEILFRIIAKLKAQGVGIIYISHRMDEIMRISDDITVMRDGEYIRTLTRDEADINQLIALMVGRPMQDIYPRRETPAPAASVAPVLAVNKLNAAGLFHDVSFTVRPGEVLGLFGLIGAGRSDVMKAIFGMLPHEGEIQVAGKPVRIASPSDAIRNGIAFVTENRKDEGLVLAHSVERNINSVALGSFANALGFMHPRAEIANAGEEVRRLSIKTANLNTAARNLSGGNQQKIVLAKWLAIKPKVLILDEPTRGVDVGAKFEIYKIIRELATQGTAIVMVSSELSEILGMSDRVVVMHNKKIVAERQAAGLTQELVMRDAAGVDSE